MTATKKIIVTVKYWVGTMQYEGKATTYRGARRLAAKNRNAFGPQFYDQDGRELYDIGNGLAYAQESDMIYIVL